MQLVQQWASLIGLVMDFGGVLLLTREWPFIFGRGLRRFGNLAANRHLRMATKLQAQFAKATNRRRREPRRWLHWCYDFTIWGLRRRSRTEAKHIKSTAAKIGGFEFSLLDSNGILDPASVEVFGDRFDDYVSDLLENGEARDGLAVRGLIWILAGLGLQIFGNLPLPW